MAGSSPTTTHRRKPDGLAVRRASLRAARIDAAACRRCELWERATQTVFGEGPVDAAMMLVGEQPGDREDLEPQPSIDQIDSAYT